MSRQIRISDRAWDLISAAGAFGESTSDVVDRLLGIGLELPAPKPGHPTVGVERDDGAGAGSDGNVGNRELASPPADAPSDGVSRPAPSFRPVPKSEQDKKGK